MGFNLIKNLRYFYWLINLFFKKNLRLILISFLINFFIIIVIISIYPYLKFIFFNKKIKIGIAQIFNFENLPLEITSKISNGLFLYTEKGQLKPVLVDHWEKSKDGLIYRFYLKKNLLWTDGKIFVANDINYNFSDIDKKIINDFTIEFYLKKPLAIFPIYLSQPLIRKSLIGIGGSYYPGQIKINQGRLSNITLLPIIKSEPVLIYNFFNTENQMLTAYKKGEITQMTVSKKTIADQFKNWKNTEIIKKVNYNRVLTLFFNFNNQFLKEKEIRQAILSGINLYQFSEYGEVAKGPFNPLQSDYNEKLKNIYYQPEVSKKIINNYISATQSADFSLKTYLDLYDIAENIINDLKKINLNVSLDIINSQLPDNFDFFLAYLQIPKDFDQYYFWHSTQKTNIGHYKNIKIDKLLEDGRGTLDNNKRKEIYRKIQEIFQNDPPALFLFYPNDYQIQRK